MTQYWRALYRSSLLPQKGGLAVPSALSLPLTMLVTYFDDACSNLIGQDNMCRVQSQQDQQDNLAVWIDKGELLVSNSDNT